MALRPRLSSRRQGLDLPGLRPTVSHCWPTLLPGTPAACRRWAGQPCRANDPAPASQKMGFGGNDLTGGSTHSPAPHYQKSTPGAQNSLTPLHRDRPRPRRAGGSQHPLPPRKGTGARCHPAQLQPSSSKRRQCQAVPRNPGVSQESWGRIRLPAGCGSGEEKTLCVPPPEVS